MANNELSGPLTLVGLYNKIKKWKNIVYNYLFLIKSRFHFDMFFI